MRILITIPYYEPAWAYGGPPRLISRIARALAKHHVVTVLTTDVLDESKRCEQREETLGGVTVVRFPVLSNTLAWRAKIIIPRGYTKAIGNYVEQADFVILSDYRHWMNAVILPYLRKHKVRYALAAFGQLQLPREIKWPLKRLFDAVWGRKLIQHATWLFAQTHHEANDYIEFGGAAEHTKLVPLIEEAPTEAELNTTGKFRAQNKIPESAKIILFVGRINKLKGLDILLHAFAETRKQLVGQDIRLVIIGRDDGYQTQVDALIKRLSIGDYVIQTGPLYTTDNAAAYNDADLFAITPTFYEETSLASVRALSFGLPVLTVPQSELPWLDEYRAGNTVECTVSDVTTGLTELLADATLLKNSRGNAKKLFNEHYTLEPVIRELEDVISTKN